MEHPEFEVIEDDAEASIHFDRITPVHPAGDGIPVKVLREYIHRALDVTDLAAIPRLWPDPAEAKPLPLDIWRSIHFPQTLEEAEVARVQLVRDVFFGVQLQLAYRRSRVKNSGGLARPGNGLLWKKLKTLSRSTSRPPNKKSWPKSRPIWLPSSYEPAFAGRCRVR